MKKPNLFFWQPQFDFLRYLEKRPLGKIFIIIFNYTIWLFLFYIAFILIKNQTNIFWQLFIATIIGEIIEKIGKNHAIWRRPLFQRHDTTPVGLVDRWYKTGSFPSGHTIKATYFFLFVLQYLYFSPTLFLAISLPLLIFRVVIGFHYPVDMFGGLLFGFIIWLMSHQIIAPASWNQIIQVIFNAVFFIK